jgi:hypothetical protein
MGRKKQEGTAHRRGLTPARTVLEVVDGGAPVIGDGEEVADDVQ